MDQPAWDGRSYYGETQLRAAPFNNPLVGSYIFLAGLSGAAQLLATLFDRAQGAGAAPTVRRGRYLAMLAPTLGTLCLILDLHTPHRFYNMLRVVKSTSPMSLGSWGLVGFSAASAVTAALQFVTDRLRWSWPRGLARVTQLPAALAGGFIGTYTASLLSATSTPLWAAAPKSLAVRFASSAVASAAAALRLGERNGRSRRNLDSIAIGALAVELAATLASEDAQRHAGIAQTPRLETQLDNTLPLVLLLASALLPGRLGRGISAIGSLAVLGGGLAMRIGVLSHGDQSASQPRQSLRFAQPDNLPRS
ncbi:MAG TPA: NrfD/PsrC family molybdoenzyme membrane anchor subunit [Acetobacteraceae bacterium]|nr:NrfD/PsrC family molybdoenzyme membrane anchor subunit [Acetobacteraceae bacterium]